jgi:16S rRNA (guanine527-N7)-methyltransferase
MQRKLAASDERNQTKALAAQVRSLVAAHLDAMRFAPERVLFLDRIEQLSAMIAMWGARMNLTAEPGDPRAIAFHIIDSLTPIMFANNGELLPHPFRAHNQVLDLGSGAGFPGLVLASASPANFTLIESRRKRASFLTVAAAEIDLKNVVVESRRIKPLATSSHSWEAKAVGHFDVVTARSYAVPQAFHSVAASALRPDGIAILYANPGQNLALTDAEKNGLYEFQPVAYSVPRGGRAVERILAMWRRR